MPRTAVERSRTGKTWAVTDGRSRSQPPELGTVTDHMENVLSWHESAQRAAVDMGHFEARRVRRRSRA